MDQADALKAVPTAVCILISQSTVQIEIHLVYYRPGVISKS